jgi:hypothetical protein
MTRQRVLGVASGYEDLNDHEALRFDQELQTAMSEDDTLALAGKSTLCRMEQRVNRQSVVKAHELLWHHFIEQHDEPPREIVLDFDGTDVPVHGKVAKGTLTRTAMDYTLNQWPTLVGYCERGDLQISNVVLAENAIRPFALGRKAWLFADTSRGACASATCYSLVETAKANSLEPSAYLQYVLERIAEADTLEALEALLPWNVDLERASKKVSQID